MDDENTGVAPTDDAAVATDEEAPAEEAEVVEAEEAVTEEPAA